MHRDSSVGKGFGNSKRGLGSRSGGGTMIAIISSEGKREGEWHKKLCSIPHSDLNFLYYIERFSYNSREASTLA